MLKLNTHGIYDLAVRIHPLGEITHTEGMTLGNIVWPLLLARASLLYYARDDSSFFSSSLKRAAEALVGEFRGLGIPEKLNWEGEGGQQVDQNAQLASWHISSLTQAVKDFETVMANELPGLAIYYVLQKGIYSTDDLLSHAHHHLPEDVRKQLPGKASQDICEAGKCLAFELATASAFHMWRGLETVMDFYHLRLTGHSFEAASVTRNWGHYIKALKDAKAETRITVFLDHIREEYRNPISHPSDTLNIDESFSLFSAGLSAITQAMKAALKLPNVLPSAVPVGTLAVKAGSP